MANQGNKISHGTGINKQAIYTGSTVMVMANHEGLSKDDHELPFKVKELRVLGALVDINGIERVIPYAKLALCRSETDKMDVMGHPLKLGDGVTICSYGGNIAKLDVGNRCVIEKLNKKSAKVRFYSDYAKVRNIPYSYLRK